MLKPLVGAAILAGMLGGACVPEAPGPLLNSERIEQTFGSYGIAVVYSDASLRLSNLYSLENDEKITRSFAIVGYPESIDPAYAAEHETILAGGSIGATFEAAGWDVVKMRHAFYTTTIWRDLVPAMRVEPGTPLATDAYELEIARGDEHFDYATIIELQHPDYLTLEALERIYGRGAPASPADRERYRALQSKAYETLAGLDPEPGESALGQ